MNRAGKASLIWSSPPDHDRGPTSRPGTPRDAAAVAFGKAVSSLAALVAPPPLPCPRPGGGCPGDRFPKKDIYPHGARVVGCWL